MNYVCVCYVYKLNAILLRIVKSQETKDMLQAFESIYEKLEGKGYKPTLHVMLKSRQEISPQKGYRHQNYWSP